METTTTTAATTTNPNADYPRLSKRLGRVRRAWKRTMALSGLVVVLSEAAGLVALAVLIDFLFALRVEGRLILLASVIVATLALLARHVVAPLVRRITEPQLALYLEERNPQFEGSLIAAVEFGPTRGITGAQARIIESIVLEANLRVDKFDLRKAVDLRRFRKYGALAVLLLAAYAISVIVLPDSVGKHVTRVVAPWRPTREELLQRQKEQQQAIPVGFTLSRTDTSLLRGSSFDLEATLSRAATEQVCFHFRPFDPRNDKAAWKLLPMKEIEKLNGFQLVLPDVNEDLEFYVASGSHKSSVHRLSVFDPLAIQGAQVTTKLPAYLGLPERIEQAAAPDVSALVGSSVTVRLVTNRPLARGEITWADGTKQPMRIEPDHKDQAAVSFEVKADTTFQYRVIDINGQEAASAGPASVRALLDQAPTIKLLQPEGTATTHPLGEIGFIAEVADDYGIAAAELVFARGADPGAVSRRLPLKLDSGNALGTLALESLTPALQPGEMITGYVECRDQKGQTAVTDLVLITIVPFDAWSCWDEAKAHEGVMEIHDLEPILKATWRLHTQKAQIAPKEFDRQAEELAATMVDPKTKKLFDFVDLKLVPPGEKMDHAKKAIELIAQGHGELKAHDTGKAVGSFRAALAEMALAGLADILQVRQPPPAASSATARMEELKVKMEQPAQVANAPKPPPEQPKTDKEKEAANEAEKLQKQQEQLANKLKQNDPKDDAKADKEKEKAAGEQAKAQAPEQKDLAEKARDVAQKMKEQARGEKTKDAAEKLANASRTMHEAAKHMEKAEHEQAKKKAEEAAKELANVVAQLKADTDDEVGKMLDKAEEQAQRLAREQKQLKEKAEKLAEALPPNKKPDAKQEKDLKVQTREQADLNKKIEEFAKDLEKLDKKAKDGQVKEDTAKQIGEAHLQMKRNRVEQKAANAAVEMAAGHPENAAEEQKKAQKGLEKVAEAIQAANDARAAGHEAELKRARNEAERIKQVVEKPNPADRKAEAEKAAADAQRLARHLKQREFVKGDPQFAKDSKQLEETAIDPSKVQKMLEDPKLKESDFPKVVARLHNKLEAEYQAMLAAKSLFASQREECPPQYRLLVNRYFEALSTKKE